MPLYIIALGGTPFIVGLVVAAFGATSVILRPLIGAWADRWHGGGVMLCGLMLLAASVLFCFLPFLGAILLANALRGTAGRHEYRRLHLAVSTAALCAAGLALTAKHWAVLK